jgi:hypothetical protein
MAERRRRRALFPRLLSPRRTRHSPLRVGTCAVCGVAFAAYEQRREHVEEVLRVHQSICPGGSRAGHVVEPYD